MAVPKDVFVQSTTGSAEGVHSYSAGRAVLKKVFFREGRAVLKNVFV